MKHYRISQQSGGIAFSDDEFVLLKHLGVAFIERYGAHEKLEGSWQELDGMSEVDDRSATELCISGARLYVSSKAEMLFPLLSQYGELLPFRIEGERFWLFNCLRKLDDVINIKTRKDKSGNLIALSFNGTAAEEGELWISNINNYTALYCTESFKNRCENLGLKGVEFKPEAEWLL